MPPPSNTYEVKNASGNIVYRQNTKRGYIDYDSEGNIIKKIEVIKDGRERIPIVTTPVREPTKETTTTTVPVNQNEQRVENILYKNLGAKGVQKVQTETFIQKQANVFPSFQTTTQGVTSGVVYGRTDKGELYKGLQYQYQEPRTVKKEEKKNVFTKGFENIQVKESELLKKQEEQENKKGLATPKEAASRLGVQAGLFGLGVIKGATYPILKPKETVKGIITSIKYPVKTIKSIGKEFTINPAGTVGSFYGTGKLIKAGEAGIIIGRDVSIGLTSKTVPSSKFLDVKVAAKVEAGAKAFPTSKSVSDSLIKFEKGKTTQGTYKVLSASPEPITTLKQSRLISIGKGTGVGRTEGLYAASYEKGSPYFFKIGKQEGYSFSILPKIAQRPTLSSIEVKGIKRIPQPILKQGVEFENLYLQTKGISGEGTAYITGNIERRFNPKLPKGFKTSETEVVIPAGSILKSKGGLLGYKESFKFKGRRIPVREYEVVSESLGKSRIKIENPFVSKGKYVKEKGGYSYYAPKENVSLSSQYLKLSSKVSKYKPSSKSYSSLSNYSSFNKYPEYKVNSYKLLLKPQYNLQSKVYQTKSSVISNTQSPIYYYNVESNSKTSYNFPRVTTNIKKGITIPKLKLKELAKTKTYKSKLSFKPKYKPTIEAQIFKVKARNYNPTLASTGLILRPIITR